MDVNHKFSLIIQSVFENNPLFTEYTKALSSLRTRKSMSKIARIVSPNQRVMSRYMVIEPAAVSEPVELSLSLSKCRNMNLTPLFKWGMKMIILLDNNKLTEEEKTELSFLEPLRTFIFDIHELLMTLNKIQKLLKDKGFNNKTKKEAKSFFSSMRSHDSLKVKKQVDNYLDDLYTKTNKGKTMVRHGSPTMVRHGSPTVCCSLDIIESCFGKYKEIVNGNKSVGISDLCLYIAAGLGNENLDRTKKAMENVSMKQVKEWKIENVSKTLFAEKMELNKILNEVNS